MRSVCYMLAAVQSWVHLVCDYDKIVMRVSSPHPTDPSGGRDLAVPSPQQRMRRTLPHRAQLGFLRCLSLAVVGPVVYSIFFRRTVWSWTSFFVRISGYIPRSPSEPPSTPPYQFSLLVRLVAACFLLVMLWETAAATFEAFFAQEPVRNFVPLTNRCRDQNGALLTGLKSKRYVSKVITLRLVCTMFLANFGRDFCFLGAGPHLP